MIIIDDDDNNNSNNRIQTANCLQHVRSISPGSIVCKSRATPIALITRNMCYVPRGTKGQLSY